MMLTKEQMGKAEECAVDMAAKLVCALDAFTRLSLAKGKIKHETELMEQMNKQEEAARALFSQDRKAAYTAMVNAAAIFLEAKSVIQDDLVEMGLTEAGVQQRIISRILEMDKAHCERMGMQT